MTDLEKCARCRFYLPDKKVAEQGRCRRFPPSGFRGISSESPGEVYSWGGDEFPRLREDEWCGEFQPRAEAEKKEGEE